MLKKLLQNKPQYKNPAMKYAMAIVDFCNSTTVQTLLYAAFVFVFQMLTETLRNPKLEFFFDKMFKDTIIDNHFDSSHNTFEDVRRIADIYEWGNYVLWPGLFGNLGPFADVGRPGEMAAKGSIDQTWPDGDTVTRGLAGVVAGPANREPFIGKGVMVKFACNKEVIFCFLAWLSRSPPAPSGSGREVEDTTPSRKESQRQRLRRQLELKRQGRR